MARNKIFRSATGKGRWLFLLMIIMLVISLFYQKKTAISYYTRADVEDFQRTLLTKEKHIGRILDMLEDESRSEDLFAELARQHLQPV